MVIALGFFGTSAPQIRSRPEDPSRHPPTITRCFPTGMFEIPAARNFDPLGFGARILSFHRVQPLVAWPEGSVARGVSLDFITHARIPLS
jgi:hypothetical protein